MLYPPHQPPGNAVEPGGGLDTRPAKPEAG